MMIHLPRRRNGRSIGWVGVVAFWCELGPHIRAFNEHFREQPRRSGDSHVGAVAEKRNCVDLDSLSSLGTSTFSEAGRRRRRRD